MRSLHYICGFQLLPKHKGQARALTRASVTPSPSSFSVRLIDSPRLLRSCVRPSRCLAGGSGHLQKVTRSSFFFFAERKPWQPALAAISRRKRSRHLLLDASLSADTAAVTPAQSCNLGTVQAVHERHICQMFGFPILKTGLLYYAAGYILGEMQFFAVAILESFPDSRFNISCTKAVTASKTIRQHVCLFFFSEEFQKRESLVAPSAAFHLPQLTSGITKGGGVKTMQY